MGGFFLMKLWRSRPTKKCFAIRTLPVIKPYVKSSEYDSIRRCTVEPCEQFSLFRRSIRNDITEEGGLLKSKASSSMYYGHDDFVLCVSSRRKSRFLSNVFDLFPLLLIMCFTVYCIKIAVSWETWTKVLYLAHVHHIRRVMEIA